MVNCVESSRQIETDQHSDLLVIGRSVHFVENLQQLLISAYDLSGLTSHLYAVQAAFLCGSTNILSAEDCRS